MAEAQVLAPVCGQTRRRSRDGDAALAIGLGRTARALAGARELAARRLDDGLEPEIDEADGPVRLGEIPVPPVLPFEGAGESGGRRAGHRSLRHIDRQGLRLTEIA